VSADTPTAGYPVHAVERFHSAQSEHRVMTTTWRGQCGTSGTIVGDPSFSRAGNARKLELCPQCFPGRHWRTCRIDAPHQVDTKEEV
jgi:hypothetical protein